MHESFVREGYRSHLVISSWNVEGLTAVKIEEVCTYMLNNSVDIMCLQETRRGNSDTFCTDRGFQVFESGRGDGLRETAGVAFVISPRMRAHILSFTPHSSRVAALKIRVRGGCMGVVCVYAPHNLKPLPDRLSFYDDLERSLRSLSVNGAKLFVRRLERAPPEAKTW